MIIRRAGRRYALRADWEQMRSSIKSGGKRRWPQSRYASRKSEERRKEGEERRTLLLFQFTKCPHSGRLLNWEGMCQGCHMRTTTYPLEWHFERLTEHRKSHLQVFLLSFSSRSLYLPFFISPFFFPFSQLTTDLISLPFNSPLLTPIYAASRGSNYYKYYHPSH